jgi:hypothetical protein
MVSTIKAKLVTFGVFFLGMTNSSVTVGATVVNVKLTSSSRALEGVVVVGYGTQKEKKVVQSSKGCK